MSKNVEKVPFWICSVFTCFKNDKLKESIETWADKTQCMVNSSVNDSDIIAIPYFVAVVDREILGKDAWYSFVEFATCLPDEDEPFVENHRIIILDEGIYPDYPVGMKILFCSQSNTGLIVKIIDNEYRIINRVYDNAKRYGFIREKRRDDGDNNSGITRIIFDAWDALVSSGKAEWKADSKIPHTLHHGCEVGIDMTHITYTGVERKTDDIGLIVIDVDQSTETAIDPVMCRCQQCGKKFQLNAGYVGALMNFS